MSRRAARFTKAELNRAIKAAQLAGIAVDRVEIDADGKIVVSSVKATPAPIDKIEEWKAKRHARAS